MTKIPELPDDIVEITRRLTDEELVTATEEAIADAQDESLFLGETVMEVMAGRRGKPLQLLHTARKLTVLSLRTTVLIERLKRKKIGS